MNIEEKKNLQGRKSESSKIYLDYVTVRQSISFLLLRIILLELLAAGGIICAYFLISNFVNDINTSFYSVPVFLFLVLVKIIITIFIVTQWVNEYYKISSEKLVHKAGFIFKRIEVNRLSHLTSLEISQGFWGRVLNYGTIKLFNWSTEKSVLLYLIHNPKRYANILSQYIPEVDEDKKILREHFFEED